MSIEGIPNGWRLVRVGRVCHGETRIDSNGNPLKWSGLEPSKLKNYVIIEPIKDSKQYREPDLSDLANGPIEIQACTPDPHTGKGIWRKRKLVAIQTGGRKPFVVQHPNQPGLVVCYKEARIEVVASSEASQSKIIPVNIEHIDAFIGPWPREIPPGFMLLHSNSKDEPREIGDCFWCVSRGRWEVIPDEILEKANQQSWTAIRRIPAEPIKVPDGWRELDESDHIEQSDMYDDGNRWMPYTYDPASPKSVRFSKSIHVRHIRKIKEPAADHIADASEMVKSIEDLEKELEAIVCDHHVCELAKPTGVTCPPDSCDIDDGVRDAHQSDHIADANKMVPPAGYRLLDKSAKVEPRKAGDLFWSLTLGDWKALSAESEQDANRDDWPACRKIETANPSEAPSSLEAEPLAIPDGWRELEEGELLSMHDLYELNGEWTACKHDPLGDRYNSRIHRRHIRKIEAASQAEQVKVTIYREPTQRDLANGPIRCRVRDSKESEWEILNLYAVLPERIEMRFVAMGDTHLNCTTWKYCEIPSDHQAIRVGDLVRVTARQVGVYRVGWVNEMNRQVNKVAKVSGITHDGRFLLNGCGGWRFHRDWLELVETVSEAKGGEA